MSTNDKNQPSVAASVPQPVPAAVPKEKTRPENPPIKEPNLPNQVKVTHVAQAVGGKK
jgi:hypothetical protein